MPIQQHLIHQDTPILQMKELLLLYDLSSLVLEIRIRVLVQALSCSQRSLLCVYGIVRGEYYQSNPFRCTLSHNIAARIITTLTCIDSYCTELLHIENQEGMSLEEKVMRMSISDAEEVVRKVKAVTSADHQRLDH